MTTVGTPPAMDAHRAFWRVALLAGGSTTVPRWTRVLGVPADRISRTDGFFDRGGTSLSAVEFAIALDRAVSLPDLVRHPVLADLAALLDERTCRAGDRTVSCLPDSEGSL